MTYSVEGRDALRERDDLLAQFQWLQNLYLCAEAQDVAARRLLHKWVIIRIIFCILWTILLENKNKSSQV